MFSGIVDQVGEVARIEASAAGRRMLISAPGYWKDVGEGSSVAIDGVCLTIVRCDERDSEFDVVPETLRRSTLGALLAGSRVNLQKSLAAGERIDGHFVQGHVDAIGRIERVDRGSDAMWHFTVENEAMAYIVPKGSVAIDGISLTVASISPNGFSVALIPTTLSRTTLGGKKPGDQVNIETDILVRALVHRLESFHGVSSTQ